MTSQCARLGTSRPRASQVRGRQRIARVRVNERLERALHLRPPRGVCAAPGAAGSRPPGPLFALINVQQTVRRPQTIQSAVDDEERLVQQVVRKESPFAGQRTLPQPHHKAVQRQEAREGRRVAHRHVIRAGGAVGHAAHTTRFSSTLYVRFTESRIARRFWSCAVVHQGAPLDLRDTLDLLGAFEPPAATRPAPRGRPSESRPFTPPCSWMRTWYRCAGS